VLAATASNPPLRHVGVESREPHKLDVSSHLPPSRTIANHPSMSMRWKKLLGIFLLIAIIAIYALLAMRVGVAVLPEANGIVTFVYYAVAGMAWVIPVRYLIVWMNTPGKSDVNEG
jgi:Protein of unknown function (DUF2842)